MKIILDHNDIYDGNLDKLKDEIKISSNFIEKKIDSSSFYYNWINVKSYLTNKEIIKYKKITLYHNKTFRMLIFNEQSYRKMLKEVKDYWKDSDEFDFDYIFEENWKELEEEDLNSLYNYVDNRLKFYKHGLDVRVDIKEAYVYIDLKLFNTGLSVEEFLSQDKLIRDTFIKIFREISRDNVRCYRWNSSGYKFDPMEPLKLIQYEGFYKWAVDIMPNGDIQFFFLDGLKNIVYCNGVGGDKGIYLIGNDLVDLFKSKYSSLFDDKYYKISYYNM